MAGFARKRSRLILLFLLLIAGGVQAADAATVEREIRKRFEFRPGGDILLDNVNGRVEIRTWEREEVEVYARVVLRSSSRRRAERYLEEVEIRMDHGRRRLNIEVDYPWRSGGSWLSWLFGRSRPSVRVDFELRVPQRADLDISLVNGSILVKGLEGRIDCRTTNGDIRVEDAGGQVSCKTVNGGIRVELAKIREFDEMRFQTVNGSIRLLVPKELQATLEASTVNGRIHTSIPIQVKGKISRRSIEAELNGGGGYIILKTVNGSIYLKPID
jgi:hypothetical protein